MPTIEVTAKRIVIVSTVKDELTGAELAAKLDKKYPDNGYGDARAIGRGLSQAIKDGKLKKVGPKSRPRYRKPRKGENGTA